MFIRKGRIWLIVFIFSANNIPAQEFSIGIHFSPIAPLPMMAKPAVTNHPSLKAKKYNINASAGINLNYRVNRLCIEAYDTFKDRSVWADKFHFGFAEVVNKWMKEHLN